MRGSAGPALPAAAVIGLMLLALLASSRHDNSMRASRLSNMTWRLKFDARCFLPRPKPHTPGASARLLPHAALPQQLKSDHRSEEGLRCESKRLWLPGSSGRQGMQAPSPAQPVKWEQDVEVGANMSQQRLGSQQVAINYARPGLCRSRARRSAPLVATLGRRPTSWLLTSRLSQGSWACTAR